MTTSTNPIKFLASPGNVQQELEEKQADKILHHCYRDCLKSCLSPEQRQTLYAYYPESLTGAKLAERRAALLAATGEIEREKELNTLQQKVHKWKEKLKACVGKCAAGKGLKR